MKISSGKVIRPQKVVIYGSEGIGKSTLAAQFPNPLFIDTEGGTAQLDVRRIEKPQSFEELISIVNEVAADPTLCKTLILDTADWAEQLCITGICNKYKKPGIEDFGYGKGYTYLAEEYSRLLGAFDAVISAGMHVVITAHAKMRKFEQPDEMGAYDRWEMKLSKQVAPLLKEWCDLLLFCNYRTFVVTTQNDTKKAQGGKRVMFTSHHPCWDAKNRHSLPEELELDYSRITNFERGHFAGSAKLPACNKATLTLEVDTREGCAYVKYDLILARSLEWKISSFFRCIGQKKHGERLVMDWNKVVGSEGRARFKHRPYTDKNGEQRVTNDVDTFYDYNSDFFSKKQTPSWVAEAEKAPPQSWEQGSF